MNALIKANELRVVASVEGGKDRPLGIMSRQEALTKAKEMGGLDLIVINDKSDPPVCKIVDYRKYRYIQEKKAKEVKKNSKVNEVKEVKMSYKIDDHDYLVRKKNAERFIQQGNRVKATVTFRGREMQHNMLGYNLLKRLTSDLESVATRLGTPKRDGRSLSLVLGPKAEILRAVNEKRKRFDTDRKEKRKQLLEEKAASREARPGAVESDELFLDEADSIVDEEGGAWEVFSPNEYPEAREDEPSHVDSVEKHKELSFDDPASSSMILLC